MTLYEQLTKDGWIQTDASCNQYYKEIEEDSIYLFREDRIVNPRTGETVTVINEMIYDDYDWFDLVENCAGYGYDAAQVDKWITMGKEIPLMLECIFEQLPNDLMDELFTTTPMDKI